MSWFLSLLIQMSMLLLEGYSRKVIPPKQPPIELLSQYTRNGSIPMAHFYVDDTNTTTGGKTHFKFSEATMQIYLRGAERSHGEIVRLLEARLDDVRTLATQLPKEKWIFLALLRHYPHLYHSESREVLKALVVGSMEPWIEAWLIYQGFDEVIVSEYNDLTYEHDRVQTIPGGLAALAADVKYNHYFDVAVSMSSFDHDGLGRYGDSLRPDGDLEAMALARSVLKPAGLLFLSVPIGPDVLVWNLHRRYGSLRLPLLLDGWTVIDRVGWEDYRVTQEADWKRTYEPILVLQPGTLPVHEREL